MGLSISFYEDSIRYFDAASIISMSDKRDIDDQLFITPITFLYRHSIELILKALILKFIEQYQNDDFILSFKLINKNGETTKNKLLSCHSLNALFECLKHFDGTNRLVSMFDNDEEEFIYKVIQDVDYIDYASDYFRYPIGKNKQQHKRNFLEVSESDIMPDLSTVYSNFIFETKDDKVLAFTSIEKEYIELSENIKIVSRILIKKYV